jgi:hypothetical protein
MSKLDEIEERVNLFGPDDMFHSDTLFVLEVARRAVKMAEWYADANNTVRVCMMGTGNVLCANSDMIIPAAEFLSFLEKGE